MLPSAFVDMIVPADPTNRSSVARAVPAVP